MVAYRVKVLGANDRPEVINQSGQTVTGATVEKIEFPSQSTTGLYGDYNYISGPGSATILVNGQKHSGVPLC